jgi:hypothetical protein
LIVFIVLALPHGLAGIIDLALRSRSSNRAEVAMRLSDD